jgi:hypothetical protein
MEDNNFLKYVKQKDRNMYLYNGVKGEHYRKQKVYQKSTDHIKFLFVASK